MPRPDRRGAAAAAAHFLSDIGWSGLPVDPIEIARRAEIPVEAIDTTDFSGCLLRHGNRFGVFYSTAIDNDGFRRFTISHELAHHELRHHHEYLFKAGEVHKSRSNFVSQLWYEQEADAFAAALLMPEVDFMAEMRKQGIGLGAIKAFAAAFQTSLTSTAIRYAELTDDPVIIVVSEAGRVLYSFQSGCVKRYGVGYLAPGSPVPNASATGRLRKEGLPGSREREGRSYLCAWFDRASQNLEFNEDIVELGSYGRTLTVLHQVQIPDRDDPDDSDADEDDGGLTPDGKRYRFR